MIKSVFEAKKGGSMGSAPDMAKSSGLIFSMLGLALDMSKGGGGLYRPLSGSIDPYSLPQGPGSLHREQNRFFDPGVCCNQV